MTYYPEETGIVGVLPDGDIEPFDSYEEYEDEYYDRTFELENCFEVELPEDYDG